MHACVCLCVRARARLRWIHLLNSQEVAMTQHTVGMFSGVCTKICLDKSYTDVWMVETATVVVFVSVLFCFFPVVEQTAGWQHTDVGHKLDCSQVKIQWRQLTQIQMHPVLYHTRFYLSCWTKRSNSQLGIYSYGDIMFRIKVQTVLGARILFLYTKWLNLPADAQIRFFSFFQIKSLSIETL